MSRRLRVEPGSLRAGSREIDGDSYHYLFRVRRLRAGDSLVLFDGAGVEASAILKEIPGNMPADTRGTAGYQNNVAVVSCFRHLLFRLSENAIQDLKDLLFQPHFAVIFLEVTRKYRHNIPGRINDQSLPGPATLK